MNSNAEVVSAFEAKTRLSELLRETEKGVSFRILRRGKEVARLIPPLKE
ncbi:MAG: type II toxin-antitoxin system prevent-host-death family antitoxin, partial [Deltaproteobacteria bacterium]|nr:type II toxin-antitoxin system prevent-host-death family antitoxin [Deltaproteobacteria bacterium]